MSTSEDAPNIAPEDASNTPAEDATPPPSFATVDKATIYDARFWTAYAANLLLVAANALTFRFADFVAYLDGSEADSGYLVSFGVTGAVVFRLFSGGWMDRFGIARVWWIGTVAFVLGLGLILTATEIDAWLYAGRFAFSTGLATLFSCSMSHIQNGVPATHRTEVIASLGSSGFLGLMTGTLLADAICWLVPGQSAATFQALFGTSVACGVIYLGLIAWLTRHDVLPNRSEPTPPSWTLLRRHFPGPVVACGFFMGGGFAVSSTFLTRFVHEREFSGIGTFFVTYALSAFCFRVISRTWSRRVGRPVLIVVGMLAQAVGFAVIPMLYVEWLLTLPALLIGFGHALLFPAVVSLGTATFPAEYRGTGTTLILGTFDLGQLVLAPLFGLIIDAYGFTPMFLATAGTAVGVTGLFVLLSRSIRDNDGHAPVPTSVHHREPTVLPARCTS